MKSENKKIPKSATTDSANEKAKIEEKAEHAPLQLNYVDMKAVREAGGLENYAKMYPHKLKTLQDLAPYAGSIPMTDEEFEAMSKALKE